MNGLPKFVATALVLGAGLAGSLLAQGAGAATVTTTTGYLESAASGLTLSVPDLSGLSSQYAMYKAYVQSVDLQSLSLTLGAHHTVSTVMTKTVHERVKTRVRHGSKYVTTYVNTTVVKKSKVKRTHYLVVNPTTCTSAGWAGTVSLDYASGPVGYSATAACS